MGDAWTLVTGASGGIGVELARLSAADGRNVILSARSGAKLEALAEELRAAHGVSVEAIAADLSEAGGADALWSKAVAGRRIDFLINNAGLGRNGRFAGGRAGDDGWAREAASIEVNVMALTRLTKLAVMVMKAAGAGRILNVASTAAFMPGPGMAVYHATKAYVVSLSRALGAELKGSGVTVSALCPGPTETGFFDAADMRGAPILSLMRPQDPQAVARVGYRAALRGKAVAVPGVMNNASVWGAKLSPAALSTFIAGRLMAKG
ncbi:SDR family oxidoreductase [Pikeienuella piscinae]|uniref:SDR family oxidoreductase n=1 Tax=Pikeienuella piscinae TaxID=2748098 RepID=A0A7L5BUV1_9RHOB|nr:SDR family oxidoreductase [Pikeienuella piscinae]QIE54823.1 SDR family oxidoreductase [Pikeienuella piscinae]